MRLFFRLIKYQILLYLLIAAGIVAVFAPVDVTEPPELKSGDVLFQTSLEQPGLVFLLLSKSLYTHTGIFIKHKGNPFVLQAGDTVDFMPLQDWIDQGLGKRYAVWRHERMVESDITQMMLAVRPFFRQPGDTLLQENNDLLYSSELVYRLFRESSLNIGVALPLRDLVGENMATRSFAERMQPAYPGCEEKSVEACHQLLLEQKVITPESLTQSNGMQKIYSNYLGGLL